MNHLATRITALALCLLLALALTPGASPPQLCADAPALPPCVEVSGVTLTREPEGHVSPDTLLTFTAEIAPLDATAPYSYTVDGGETLTATEAPITFTRFAGYGPGGRAPARDADVGGQAIAMYYVEIAVWNCAMTAPVTDTVEVIWSTPPPMLWLFHLPLVLVR